MKILVGMSGGVDSSTAAALLASQGHDVTGVIMTLWREGNNLRGGDREACYGPQEVADVESARRNCAQLGIPLQTIDCSREYEKHIVEYFRSEYLAGRTPNPCVRCNAMIKFGLLPRLAWEAGLRFDRFATGHYARIVDNGPASRKLLLKAADDTKDQSYFLCRLSQEQLSRHIFPLGPLRKTEVRAIARQFGLQASDRPDSQDFYSGDTAELIGSDDRPGDIVDEATGKVLGHHTGYWKFTIGQRRGLGVSSSTPLYVTGIDACRNRVLLGTSEAVCHHSLTAADFNWLSIPAPQAPLACQVKVRSVQKPVQCTLLPMGNGEYRAEFPEGINGVAPGQAAVFYSEELLLGGGTILSASR